MSAEPAGTPAVEHHPDRNRPRRSRSRADADPYEHRVDFSVVTDARTALPGAASAA
jgi:hypothetical protein